jgi:hypothetical protein
LVGGLKLAALYKQHEHYAEKSEVSPGR